ncbi:MAG: DoxX family protein [Cytophagales bacterium]|nr:DoxX family protein [Cytophagales bacterium]
MRITNVVYWIARMLAVLIMLQTLYFKFTASPESVYIFTTVGIEPWGRIAVGVLELVASGLLLITATAWLGAALGLGLMTGAIGMHLTLLGIEVQGDGGYLFILALVVALSAAYVLWYDQQKVQDLLQRFRRD